MENTLTYLPNVEAVMQYLITHQHEIPLGNIKNITEEKGGFANFVYKIDASNGVFFLKQRAPFAKKRPDIPRDREGIFDELSAYELLKCSLKSASIPEIIWIDHSYYLFICTGLLSGKGNLLSEILRKGIFPHQISNILGEALGTLHIKNFDSGLTVRGPVRDKFFYMRQYSWLVRGLSYSDNELREKCDAVCKRLENEKKTIIFGDLSPKNIVFNRNKIGLFDLETCAIGDPAFDLGYFAAHILLEGIKTSQLTEAYKFKEPFYETYFQTVKNTFKNISQIEHDSNIFIGTSMLYRTFGAMVPEYLTQESGLSKQIREFAENLIVEV